MDGKSLKNGFATHRDVEKLPVNINPHSRVYIIKIRCNFLPSRLPLIGPTHSRLQAHPIIIPVIMIRGHHEVRLPHHDSWNYLQ